MRNTAKIGPLVIVISILSMGCTTKNEGIITGQVQNIEASSIKVNKQTVTLDDQGGFQFILQSEKPDYVEIDFGKQTAVYLRPGDSIHVEIDAGKGLDGITFTGNNVAINQFLLQEAVESEKVNAVFDTSFMQLVSLDEKEFTAKMDEIWQPFHEIFDKFLSENKVNDKYFIKSHTAILLYSKAGVLMRYPDWKRNFSGDRTYSPTPGYYDFIDQLDLNDSELIEVEEYRAILEAYLNMMTDKELKESSAYEGLNYKPYRAKIKVTLETFTDPEVRSEMLYSFMNTFFNWYYQKGTDDLIKAYRLNCTNPVYLAEMEEFIAQDKSVQEKCDVRVYKTINDVILDAYVYLPTDIKPGKKRPAVAFFHGGGWECGKPQWGHTQCMHFSSLGLVGISFEYRLVTQHDATPLDCIMDAKSALRWMREHSEELNIDPDRIIASGFSAGGHLSLCAAMIDRFDEPYEDHSISSRPNAMLLWVTPGKIHEDSWFRQVLKDQAKIKDVDPDSHVHPGLPPSVFFQGTNDNTVSPKYVKAFVEKMQKAGNRCELHMYEGQTHLGWSANEADVLSKMDAFLESIGFLDYLK